jgi:hypothetical protein
VQGLWTVNRHLKLLVVILKKQLKLYERKA